MDEKTVAQMQSLADCLRKPRKRSPKQVASDQSFVPLSRATDPWTSYAAASDVAYAAMSHRTQILVALQSIGPSTHDELAVACNLRPDQVWRRLPELERLHLVHKTELTRPGTSGSQMTVWSANTDDPRKSHKVEGVGDLFGQRSE